MAATPELRARCTSIRTELKSWEKEFAAANGGRKASRADIKANAHIASKYKDYNKLRDIVDGRSKPHASPKRKSKPTTMSQTPTKKAKIGQTVPAATPTRRDSNQPGMREVLLSASSIFSPSQAEAMIGPTPQKDGIVLGLFDLLPAETPSKQRAVLGDIQPNHLHTPSKAAEEDDEDQAWSGRMGRGRTPISEGKRYFLDQFATPMKRKREYEDGTPSSRGQTTPMFLRRDFRPMATVYEEPSSLRAPRRPRSFMRSISSLLQERKREQEEDDKREEDAKREEQAKEDHGDFDDEEEAMRELENEAASLPASHKQPSTVLVDDSQVVMRLGPDGEGQSDGEGSGDDEQLPPRKIWKKRGAKRQTRRVTMRPVRTRAPPQLETVVSEDEHESPVIPETQAAEDGHPAEDHFDSDGETAIDSDYSNSTHTPKKRKMEKQQPPGSTTTAEKAQQPTKTDGAKKKENVVKKAARKISAHANANFRKLNIKNKNSKAKGRGWGRNRK